MICTILLAVVLSVILSAYTIKQKEIQLVHYENAVCIEVAKVENENQGDTYKLIFDGTTTDNRYSLESQNYALTTSEISELKNGSTVEIMVNNINSSTVFKISDKEVNVYKRLKYSKQ